ncbi:Leucine-rich repeat receptor-like protein kinase [Arachis hypogaea]|nr:Leucine-rich repeat receptor-like protein kinase [Arachis hypogaea]
MRMTSSVTLLFLILCFSNFLYNASALVSDDVTLCSLLTHWTFVPLIINSTWNGSDSVLCSWIGVQCNHAYDVISLNLSDLGIQGQLGPEIGQLHRLQTLVLSNNGFLGKVPSELSNCTLLQVLDFSNNSFCGLISNSFKKLQSLRSMNLSSNLVNGAIQDSLFQIRQPEEMNLHNNHLSGPIPTGIGNLTELLRLHLHGNRLSGTISSSIGNCSKLEELFLNENRLSGELSLEMAKLKNLKTMSLFDNQFSGVIPQDLGINSSIVKLDFTNLLPNLCFRKKLKVLNMGSNRLQSNIPSDVGRCTSISGIPSFFSERSKLRELQLSGNLIGGTIPPSLEKLQKLLYGLNLSSNGLTGNIDVLAQLALIEINISYNFLYGLVPTSLCKFLDSSSSSFLGNPYLNVSCSPSSGLDQTNTSMLVALLLIYLRKKEMKNYVYGERGAGRISFLYKEEMKLGAHGIVYRAQLGYTTFAVKKFAFERNKRKLLDRRELWNLAEHSYCQSHSWKKLLTYVVGTAGYIAPVQSKKSDVYSYGEVVDLDIANAFPNSRVLARQVTEVLLLALRCTKRKPRERPTMKDITSFYQKNIFKLSCDDVDMVNENIVNVVPQPYNISFLSTNPVSDTQSDSYMHDLSQSEDSLVDWNVMATTKTVVDGFIVKLIGNGKIYTEQHNVLSLNLTNHGIPGQLGSEIRQLHYLKTLVLANNGFSEKVTSELSNYSLLQLLDLSNNSFSGQIPYSFKKLQNLQYMSLSFNLLSGEIPDFLFQIPQLQEVNLHSNHLSGPIPTRIGNLTELLRFDLHGNRLTCTIPSSIGNCIKLEDLFLNENKLEGVLPLVKLDLTMNDFIGNIPPNLCLEKQLRVLNMGFNKIQGSLPSEVGRCETLNMLILSENHLTGSLPEFASNLNLKIMDMSRNRIGGTIPSSLEKCTNLIEINLLMNKFTGIIPSQLGMLLNLEVLNLAHNSLEGTLPNQLSNCAKMDSFDVGFNSLNGSFPSSLQSWTDLTTLILRENRFTGSILTVLSEFNKLHDLQLGGNLFGGKIPPSLGKLKNLIYGLNLSANGLTGEIPFEIGKLKVLSSLDLSSNNLTRSMDVLGELSLDNLNISYNFLHGPVSKTLMNFLNSSPSSFLENPYLCVSFSASHRSNRTKACYLKPSVYKSTYHLGISISAMVMIELGSTILVSGMLIALVFCRLNAYDSMLSHGENKKEDINLGLPWNCGMLKDAMIKVDDGCIVGRGAYAIVYKVHNQGLVLTVQKSVFRGKDNKRLGIMKREIKTLYMIKHRNLVRILGYSVAKDYGVMFTHYMENGSLHDILHRNILSPPLIWNVRLKIADGIAQGLKYLHYDCDLPIVHRDIKAQNILLDVEMEPHISNFGTANIRNLTEDSYTHSNLPWQKLSARIAGTAGYMAPGVAPQLPFNNEPDISTSPVYNTQDQGDSYVHEESNEPQDVYTLNDLRLVSTPKIGVDGLIIKVIGNGKLHVEQFTVKTTLVVPKVTYTWPYLKFLPTVTGPVVTIPFNWFFLSSWAQYMY